jgi:hypothetical protein
LDLGQLFKITPKYEKHLWQKLKVYKPYINTTKLMYEKANQFIVLDINTTKVIIDNHMAMIQVQIGRNMIDDVFVDGGFGVNITTGKLRAKL